MWTKANVSTGTILALAPILTGARQTLIDVGAAVLAQKSISALALVVIHQVKAPLRT